jgi:hypothetical protein
VKLGTIFAALLLLEAFTLVEKPHATGDEFKTDLEH